MRTATRKWNKTTSTLSNEKVWLGNWTLKQCREMEISLGLDLKGGMNVILEVSVPDVIKALADNKPDEAFNNALAEAAKQAVNRMISSRYLSENTTKLLLTQNFPNSSQHNS